jgi:hypothetical protein
MERGAIFYLSRLTVDMNDSALYEAAVNIRSDALPSDKVISGENSAVDKVFVQCGVRARLLPLGESLKIDDEVWQSSTFTPYGVIKWSWVVKAVHPQKEGYVRLEVQPAALLRQGTTVRMFYDSESSNVARFSTPVRINSRWLQRLNQWVEDNKAAASGISVALCGTLTFSEKVVNGVRRVWQAMRGGKTLAAAQHGQDT